MAAKPVADGQRTHPLPPLGLYVTLYKAFLSVSQAWCVYSELGAYPWHWRFEPSWRFTAARLIGASGRNGAGQTHCAGYRCFKLRTQFSVTLVRPGLPTPGDHNFRLHAYFFDSSALQKYAAASRDGGEVCRFLRLKASRGIVVLVFPV